MPHHVTPSAGQADFALWVCRACGDEYPWLWQTQDGRLVHWTSDDTAHVDDFGLYGLVDDVIQGFNA